MSAAAMPPRDPANQPVTIRAPRAPWMEFLLHFSTLGIYTSIWFVLRAREVNRICGKTLRPWLWFFVPQVPLAQIAALPKFLKHWNEIGQRHGVTPWEGWRGAWTAAVIVMSVLAVVQSRFELPGWLTAITITVPALLYSVLQVHLNRVKEAVEGVTFHGLRRNYSVLEWIVVIVGCPLILALCGYWILPSFRKDKPLVAGSTYIHQQDAFQIPIVGTGWSVVRNGTHSDGDAVLELQGPLEEMIFLVFKHDQSITLTEMARTKIAESRSRLTGGSCREERTLAMGRLAVISRIQCAGKYMGSPALITHTFLETDQGLYELRGVLTSVHASFAGHAPQFTRMANEFQLQ